VTESIAKYILAFLAILYLVSSVAEIVMVKGGAEAVFESVKVLVPHMMMFILGFYFSKGNK
jgi:uncharacterized membrane protein